MRVATAFNKMLGIEGAQVANVTVADAVVVELRRRRHKLRCRCGYATWAHYDHRVSRWRHLDLAGRELWLSARVARLWCRRCRKVVYETVPWARPGAYHTRDFQDMAAWLSQRTDRTTVCRLMRCSWEALRRIVEAAVAEHLDGARLTRAYRIGVDEVSYRGDDGFLTVVADHDHGGAVVWAGEGRSSATLERFYDELGPGGCTRLQAVSLDMGRAYKKATDAKAPRAAQCVDPFHVVKLANAAVDEERRRAWNAARRAEGSRRPRGRTTPGSGAQRVKRTRWALLKDPAALSDEQWGVLDELRRKRSVLYRAWQLREGLRDVLRAGPHDVGPYLEWWLAWACRSRIPAFVRLSRTLRANRERIVATVELGLSNSRLEGLNSKVRLINHRGYGHHSAEALIAMIYLCCGGIALELPLR
ncbi:MAG TPA: ISL3 family transposase [Acidimicrobiales bacterium]|nr:ISL3 family transposase [Acidimicrobiales bacterium]